MQSAGEQPLYQKRGGIESMLGKEDDNDTRPSWDNYFFGLAFMASRRSRDVHTKHGCILVDEDKKIIGTGYNGYPAGMDDNSLPKNRPQTNDPNEDTKYEWTLHSEENAVLNNTASLKGATAYITGQPCHHCAMVMAQKGIKIFKIANRKGWQKETEKTKRDFNRLITEKNICVEYITPDLSWMLYGLEESITLGFLPGFKVWIGQMLRLLAHLNPIKASASSS